MWAAITIVIAVLFYRAATSHSVYIATSPTHLAARVFGEEANSLEPPLGISLHVVLRKVYSIVAFAIVGFSSLMATGWRRPALIALLIAAYSAVIEVGQYAEGVREGWLSNGFDVLCGACGGAAAVFLCDVARRRYRRRRS